ncbi:MAG: M14 family metallopeptidase [Caulobacteraceae bacterium]
MNSAGSFSASYPQARAKFRAAAAEAGGTLASVGHPERGPDGGDLSTDVAWFGPREAERVLVMIAATHGVEGFCGSGAQVDWLTRGEAARLPAGVAVLMIHAVNPYGFAWLRRVTHENVDLNRNWIDFAAPLPANPGYDALAEAICPEAWSEEAQGASAGTLGAYAAEHGFPALQQALSGGQYAHPAGIFYGGAGPTWSRRTQSAIFGEWLGAAGKVAVIDYHTGLGPWGYGEQIVTERRGTAAFARAAAWYGGAITSPADGSSTSADIVGDGLAAAPGLVPQAEVTGMALEVGVQSINETLTALRADAWLHAHGDVASPQGQAIKAQMRAAFFGDADDWKGMVAGQSLLATRQAIRGLTR